MLKIRLQRVGKKNDPTFRVVVTEHQRGPKSGNYIENLGTYNPHTNTTVLKADRVKHWISVGAQASDTVHNILINESVIEGKKRNVLSKKSPIVKEEKEEVKVAPTEKEKTDEVPAEEENPEEPKTKTEETPTEESPKEEK